MSDTGYEAARDWLTEHGPDWVIRRSDTTLEAGPFQGAPTEQRVQVELTPKPDPLFGEHGPTLTGEGRTMLEAVQRAIGALESK